MTAHTAHVDWLSTIITEMFPTIQQLQLSLFTTSHMIPGGVASRASSLAICSSQTMLNFLYSDRCLLFWQLDLKQTEI